VLEFCAMLHALMRSVPSDVSIQPHTRPSHKCLVESRREHGDIQ
jgi:hypothetical protein